MSVVTHRVSDVVRFTPRQREALRVQRERKFTLFGGARGGGKSYFLRWLAIVLLLHWAQQGHKAVRVGIFCETYVALDDRQLSRATRGRPEEVYPSWLGTWNLAAREFRLHAAYGGGTVCFRNLDDGGKYLSAEFAAVLVDELTRSSVDVIMQLFGSLRWPGIEHTPFVGTTNPGGPGHAWVKDVFVDGTFELDETKNLLESFGREAFGFVRSLAGDNPHNAASYLAMLRGLPDRLRKGYLYGDWDAFDGQAFPQFFRPIHEVPSTLSHLGGAEIVAGLDWGYRKGAYVLAAVLPERIEVIADVPFSKLNARPAARALMRVTRNLPRPTVILYDDQMNQQTGADRLIDSFLLGLQDELGDRAPSLMPGTKGPGSRRAKYQLLSELLDWGPALADGTVPPWVAPQLVFQKRAKYLLRSIPALQVDPDRPDEDVDTDGDDHGYDALGNITLHVGARVRSVAGPRDQTDRHPGYDVKRKRRKREARAPLPDPIAERMPVRMPRTEDEFQVIEG